MTLQTLKPLNLTLAGGIQGPVTTRPRGRGVPVTVRVVWSDDVEHLPGTATAWCDRAVLVDYVSRQQHRLDWMPMADVRSDSIPNVSHDAGVADEEDEPGAAERGKFSGGWATTPTGAG